MSQKYEDHKYPVDYQVKLGSTLVEIEALQATVHKWLKHRANRHILGMAHLGDVADSLAEAADYLKQDLSALLLDKHLAEVKNILGQSE